MNEEQEIEVTPEMIEAGLRELSSFNPQYDKGSSFVAHLYRAMSLVAEKSSPLPFRCLTAEIVCDSFESP